MALQSLPDALKYGLLLAPIFCIALHPAQAAPNENEAALKSATQALCGKRIALLGENGFHGDGKTPAFKTELIQRLVKKCHFNAIFFEASHYDFLAFDRSIRKGEPVTRDMLSSSIGGIWNQNTEVQPLIDFLLLEARARSITLAGLDAQLGSRAAYYSLQSMPTELGAIIGTDLGPNCAELIRKRLWSDFPAGTPYSPTIRDQIGECLNSMHAATKDADQLSMIDNIERAIAYDFEDTKNRSSGRDNNMFLNLRWLVDRLPRKSKVIIWLENGHAAKDATLTGSFGEQGSLGALVHKQYGKQAFALGFTAAGGSFRWARGQSKPIGPAPSDSIEATALADSKQQTVFIGSSAMKGQKMAAFFGHKYMTANWGEIFDGAIVFRTERPPVRLDEPASD